MTPNMHERTRILLGDEGLARLSGCHVLVAGLGGVGGAAAEAMARAGLGRLTLLDHDTIQPSNLNRQLVALHSTLGRPKAEVMAERLRDIRPEIELHVRCEFLSQEGAEGLIREGGFDLVLDCIDSIPCKAALIHACQRQGVPVFSSLGAGGRLDVSKVGIGRLDTTHTCPLARKLRHVLRERGAALDIPVVYSWESPIKALPPEEDGSGDAGRARPVNGTISYMPNLFGMMLAGAAIQHLLTARQEARPGP